ncbi:hypothetical protein B0H14DRAFT_3456520 [Mycena olivaceomarginata]|nr:hypothetical protein B0H14DRAFT_3456520 [Mycena olivaceomarginata]
MGDDIIEDSTLAGYKTSHPLHPYFLLKIQTDGSIPLAAVLEAAASQLIATLSALEDPDDGGGVAWGARRDYLDF